jgi:hypothetical protein
MNRQVERCIALVFALLLVALLWPHWGALVWAFIAGMLWPFQTFKGDTAAPTHGGKEKTQCDSDSKQPH